MKRAAVDHPKLQRLQRRLKLSRFQAMGLMEAVWHFAGRYSPEGDIGRWADEEIAAWVEWDGDAEELIDTLVICGWLDRDPKHRLLIHDWAEHADEATKIALKRAGKAFAVATPEPETTPEPVAEAQCSDSVATVLAPPEPCQSHAMPEPETPNMASVPPADLETDQAEPDPEPPEPERRPKREPWRDDWEAFLATYPARNGDRKVKAGEGIYARIVTRGTAPPAVLLQGVRAYREWADANGKTRTEQVQQIPTWLNGQGWQVDWSGRPSPRGSPNGQVRDGPSLAEQRDSLLATMRSNREPSLFGGERRDD